MPMLFQCRACSPATDHGSAPQRVGRGARPWRTIDIHCHCLVPEANAMVLKATGMPGGGTTPNANAHVNDLTKAIQQQRGKADFSKLTDLETRMAEMDRTGYQSYRARGIAVSGVNQRSCRPEMFVGHAGTPASLMNDGGRLGVVHDAVNGVGHVQDKAGGKLSI